MRKTSFALFLSMVSLYSAHAQKPFTVNTASGPVSAIKTFERNGSGNVGIGIDKPESNLHVSGFNKDQNPNAVLQVDNNKKDETIGGPDGGTISTPFIGYSLMVNRVYTQVTGGNSYPLSTTDMVVNDQGNTGIGISAPQAKLHVATGNKESGTVPFWVQAQSVDAIFTDKNGNTGFGTTSPAYQIDVAGDANVSNTLWLAGSSNGGKLVINTGSSGQGIDIVNATNGGNYSNQIRFLNSAGAARHLIFDNASTTGQDAGNLTIYPGYGGGGSNTLSVVGKVVVGGKVPVTAPFNDYTLAVNGNIAARKLMVEISDWQDKVFEKTYSLPTLESVEAYIKIEKHLPDVPSEKDVLEKGISVGEMDATLLKKIEELTLYVLDLKKENVSMKAEIANLKK